MPEIDRGYLIVFEGIDRSGKSTQAKLLEERLIKRGAKIKRVSFPNRENVTGSVLNRYLNRSLNIDDRAVHLLFSANRWEEKYAFSGMVYSMSKGLSLEWCRGSDRGLVRPDLVLYLELSAEKAAGRDGYGVERYEDNDTQKKVGYLYGTVYDESYWKRIPGDLEPLEVHEEIVKIVEDMMRRRRGADIGELWTSIDSEDKV